MEPISKCGYLIIVLGGLGQCIDHPDKFVGDHSPGSPFPPGYASIATLLHAHTFRAAAA